MSIKDYIKPDEYIQCGDLPDVEKLENAVYDASHVYSDVKDCLDKALVLMVEAMRSNPYENDILTEYDDYGIIEMIEQLRFKVCDNKRDLEEFHPVVRKQLRFLEKQYGESV